MGKPPTAGPAARLAHEARLIAERPFHAAIGALAAGLALAPAPTALPLLAATTVGLTFEALAWAAWRPPAPNGSGSPGAAQPPALAEQRAAGWGTPEPGGSGSPDAAQPWALAAQRGAAGWGTPAPNGSGSPGAAQPPALAAQRLAAARAAARRAGWLAAALLLVGAAGGQVRLAAIDAPAALVDDGAPLHARAQLLSPPRPSPFGASAEVGVTSGRLRGARLLARLPHWVRPRGNLAVGAELEIAGRLRSLAAIDERGGTAAARGARGGDAGSTFDVAAWLRRRGVAGELLVDEVRATGRQRGGLAGVLDRMRSRAERAVSAGMPAAEGALLRGMVLGQDEAIAGPVRDRFRASGLAHLLAVSGQNVMLLAALALPVLMAAGLGVRGRGLALLALIAVYVPLAGAGPSLQRAGVMGAAGIAAMLASRPASRWYALLLAAAATLALNPRACGDPGWQLSFAAVAGILVVGRPLSRGLREALEALLPEPRARGGRPHPSLPAAPDRDAPSGAGAGGRRARPAPATRVLARPAARGLAPATGVLARPAARGLAPATGVLARPAARGLAPATGVLARPAARGLAPATGVLARPAARGLAPATGALARPVARAFADGVAITVAATLATAPLLAHHFGSLPLAGLPANVLALPAVAPAMWLGMLKIAIGQLTPAGLPVDALATGLGTAARIPVAFVALLAERFAELPGGQLAVDLHAPGALAAAYALIAAGAVALRRASRPLRQRAPEASARWRRLPRARRAALAGLLAGALLLGGATALAPPAPPGSLTVRFLDVGQGDATLIQHPDGTAVLFDGGPPEADVAGLLRRAGVRRLAIVVATHASRDHHGGLADVLARYPVGLLLDGGDGTADPGFRALLAQAARRGVRALPATAPLALRAGAVRIRLLSPPPRNRGPAPEDPNPRAVVALVSCGELDLLLSADAESDALGGLDLPDVDAIKVPHHGSADPGLPVVLRRLRPEVAAIEVGPNTYGHPHPSTLAALDRAGVRTWRTDRDGTVTLSVADGGMRVETER